MKRNVVAALLLCVCIGWAALNPRVGLAAAFVVSSTADAPDAAPGNGVCAAAGGACTLRAAVMESNAAGGGTISVPAGTYTLTISGQGEDAAAKGDLDITAGTVTITGAGRDATIIDGGKLDRIFDAKSGTNVSISGLTLQNGNGDAADSSTFSQADGGGALRAYEADVSLAQVNIKNNISASNGGGVAFSYTQFGRPTPKTLTINDCVISGNTAKFSGGGVIIGSGAKMNLAASTISGNKASALNSSDSRRGGGGLFVGQGYTPVGGAFVDTQATIASTVFANNIASDRNASNLISGNAWGGAIQAQLSTVTISGGSFSANVADGSDGGAIFTDATVLTVDGATFDGNTSLARGGAMSTLGGKTQIVRNSTFTNNKALSTSLGGGGAVYARADVSGGTYTLSDSTLNSNQTDGSGGAIQAGPNVTMARLTVKNNTAGSNGGGIDVLTSLPNAPAALSDALIQGNTATGRGGGIENGDVMTLANVTLDGNSTMAFGGGLSIYQAFSTTATNVVITNNTSADQGGGMYVRHRGIVGSSSNQPTTPVFTNVMISGNQAASAGGGVASLTSIKLVNATISGNTAKTNGGGIWLFNSFSASDDLARYSVNVDLTNATITGNTATTGSGGALYQQTSDSNNPQYAVSRINNATIVGNNAGAATGGVFLDTTVSSAANSITVQNSILAKNGGVSSPDCLIIVSAGNNLVGNSDGCVIKGAAASDQIGTMASPIDPLVSALADNGTAPNSAALQTMALQAGSPAIDKGNPATCPASDERGAPRVGTCDLGAFEFGATVPTPVTPTPVTPTPVTPTPVTPTPVTPTPVTPTPVTPGTTQISLYLPLTTR